MKVEIKFRGLSDTKTWYYGGITPNWTKGYSLIHEHDGRDAACKNETIGQLTGMKDVDGIDIYENDIVEFVYLNIYKVVGVVSINQWGHSQVEAKIVTMNGADSRKEFKHGLNFHIENAVKGKVIGNIFDNAELLETVAQHSI